MFIGLRVILFIEKVNVLPSVNIKDAHIVMFADNASFLSVKFNISDLSNVLNHILKELVLGLMSMV